MGEPKAGLAYQIAIYFEFRELFDRAPDLAELVAAIQPLDFRETVGLLCQMNADFRLRRGRDARARLQNELAGSLLDDQTLDRLKERFPNESTADRPIFHPLQILNLIQLALQHSRGTANPVLDSAAKYRLGTTCLIMNDLLVNSGEREGLTFTKTVESASRTLMMQSLAPFEIQNAPSVSHVLYRAQVLFSDVLQRPVVLARISAECQGFDFEKAFAQAVGLPLKHWVLLLVAFYVHLAQYVDQNGDRHPENLLIERTRFKGESKIPQSEIDVVLGLISSTPEALTAALKVAGRGTDWRSDFVALKSRPLIEVYPDRFFCSDLGFLVEKMHSGVYWAINDALPSSDRNKLFKAWGILFEEYVNSFLSDRKFEAALSFWPRPKWEDGTESFDGAFMQDSRFVPMEYKSGLLKIEARYSGSIDAFEMDLDKKIGDGCRQLARKIQTIFNIKASDRRGLQDIPTNHVTRIVPVLVVQDPILRGPLVNWMLNRTFDQALDREKLRVEVVVEPLTVAGIHEIETMVESAEAKRFDILFGLQSRCQADPEMKLGLHNFLLNVPGYGESMSARRQQKLDEQLARLREYIGFALGQRE
jgi:hypothetical protein